MRRVFPLAALALLAACKVGPNYAGPPPAGSAAVARGTFVRADDPSLSHAPGVARWWEGLGDPTLNALVDDALKNSPNVDAAAAKVREARAKLLQGRAALFPSASASAQYVHAELPGTGLGSLTGGSSSSGSESSSSSSSLNFYNVGANVSWEPDLFGGQQRSVEQARDTLDQRYADLADAQVSLTAQVVQSYVNLRDVQARSRLNAQSSKLQHQAVDLTRQRYAAGTASQLDVDRLQTQAQATDAQNMPLSAQVAMYEDALAVLTGLAPGELDATLAPELPVPLPPASVPIGDPAALIAHRPDVRSAERALAGSTANIGVKTAARFPSLKFSGIVGMGGTSPGDVIDPSNFSLLLLPQLSWSILDFGKNLGAVREARAQRDEAGAQYRQKVLAALQDAEDSLARFGATRRQLVQLTGSAQTATRAATLNRQRFAAGTSSLIDQLDIERNELTAAINEEQGRAQLTIDYIAVQKALGLGWQDPDVVLAGQPAK
jgi:NodT family efflux transporter outer membrane factor (OMF) lipoprotein